MKQAAQLVAAAEASEAQGQFDQAATQYRQAEEAFRAALVGARQAAARRAIEDELPALRAAREAAEQAEAATLAADAFAAAVRDQLRLEEALAAGELTRVRELLPRVREGFASAGEEAGRRLNHSVDEARAAMRAVAAEASAAGAPASAKAAFIEAEALAGAAEKLVERGQLELAVGQLGRAADAYRTALTAAARAGEREVLEKELPAIRAARADAEGAGAPALAADAFAAATREQAKLEEALAAGELTRVRELLPKVGEGFAAAKSTAVLAQASRAAAEARTAMTGARDTALAVGAEQYVPDALAKARTRESEGAAAEQREQWERAEQIYRDAAKAFEEVRTAALRRAEEQRLAAALAEARTAMEAARTRAKTAGAATGATALYGEAGAIAKKAAAAANDATGMAAAAADYHRAAERFDAATAEAERAARRSELEATLAAVEDARKQALEAGAGRVPEFAAAADELAAAQRALAADELSLVVSSASTARERFAAAKAAVERAQAEAAADAALADIAAACAEAREAGAEELAPKAWARAAEQQKQALAHRHDGDCDAVLPLAAESQKGFVSALEETVTAAQKSAATARTAAERAGADDKATVTADRAFANAEQRRGETKLVAAAVAFRKAAEGYKAAADARAAAARKAETAAKAAGSEADAADAATLAAEDHRAALGHLETATKALEGGRCTAAETAFGEAARAFRAAAQTAGRERKRAASLAARQEAEAARERALQAGAVELAATELKHATDALAAGAHALEIENYAGSEADFRKAGETFERARAAAAQAALEREAQQARAEAERLRASRAPAATGFFARRKLAKADGARARGTAAAASGDFTAAKAAFAEAAELFAAMPAPASPPPPAAPAPLTAPTAKAARGAPPVASTTGLEDATFVESSAPSLEGATVVARAPSLEGATVVESATVVERAVPVAAPAARGLPVAWIGAVAASAVLLAGVWMLRDRLGGSVAPAPDQPKIAAKTDVVPKVQVDVAPKTDVTPRVSATTQEPPAATAVPQEVAKAEEPPPAPPLPRIASVLPETALVEPAAETQQFRIALADPTGATYAWSVDGKVLSDETTPALTLKTETKPHRIAVVARTAGGEVGHEWELAALAAPPEPKVPATAPVISGFDPKERTLPLTTGKSRRFSVKARYDGGEPLRYAWSVDGKSVGGNSPTFEFAPDEEDEGATRQIRAEVSAGGGPAVRNEWSVAVPLAPVSITRQSPTPNEVLADLGDTTDFSIEARAGRAGAASLSYTWTVNQRPASDARGPRFSYRPERAGSADVEVRVDAPDRPAAVRRWTVKAREPAPVAEPTRVAALPPRVEPTVVSRLGGDAKRELESWIASYRDAYQQKNVDRLVALGVVKSENRSKLAAALDDLDDLTVTIATSSIDVQGPDQAIVTLTREDSFDAGGRRQSQSINIKKTLRKVNGAWVAQ
jgi:hypothetical protein